MIKLDEQTLQAEGQGKILVMFHFSEGCKWCQRMEPIFDEYSKIADIKCGTFSFGPFDRAKGKPKLAEELKIQSLPAFISFENGAGKNVPRDEIMYKVLESKLKVNEAIVDPSEESQCDSCQ